MVKIIKEGVGHRVSPPLSLSIHLWWLPMWYEASQLSVSIGETIHRRYEIGIDKFAKIYIDVV